MERCDECGKGTMIKKKVAYAVLGASLGKFDALECSSCHGRIFPGPVFQEIEAAARAKGVWGIAAKTRVGTSGKSLDVRLPKQLVEFLEIRKGQEVLIEPMDKKKFIVSIS